MPIYLQLCGRDYVWVPVGHSIVQSEVLLPRATVWDSTNASFIYWTRLRQSNMHHMVQGRVERSRATEAQPHLIKALNRNSIHNRTGSVALANVAYSGNTHLWYL